MQQYQQILHRHVFGFGLVFVLGMWAGVSQAATVGFSGFGSIGTGNYGNTLNVNGDDGTGVTVTAFSLVGDSLPFSSSQLYSWNQGLGVCNTNEGLAAGSCPTGPHSTDNGGSEDFILVKFASSVVLNSATLTAWRPNASSGDADSDVSYYVGMSMPNLANFAALGTERTNSTGLLSQGTARTFSFDMLGAVDWVLIGARRSQNDDGFKLKSLNYEMAVIPLPAAAILFGSGLMGLLGWTRRSAKV